MKSRSGFTIVELLIVIIVIAMLAAISVVAYNGIQSRAQVAKRDADLTSLYKAIVLARESQSKTLLGITGNGFTSGRCVGANNPDGIEPRLLAKSHLCWQTYYATLSNIATASGMNLDSLRAGDASGNPYFIDENEGEAGNCGKDTLQYFTGSGMSYALWKVVPLSGFSGCQL